MNTLDWKKRLDNKFGQELAYTKVADHLKEFISNLLASARAERDAEVVKMLEGMYRPTTDMFETMKEIRQEQINQGDWSTADTKAGYNQAIKDTIQALSPSTERGMINNKYANNHNQSR